eukprot:scaffold167970_cov76-Attheya_sp.AAC.3
MEFLRIDTTVETAKRLVKIAASNAAAAGAISTVTVVRGRWAFVGAVVLMATILSPIPFILKKKKTTTPSPSPYSTIIPKVQCPDAGAAMFAGYKVSNISEDRQLLMVTLTDLPERLELFLTNSFSLPTMSEEFPGNKTGSVKMIIPSGGFSAGTLFEYESPALAISDEFMWQNSASGFMLPEQGSDVLLYCRDDWRMMKIASFSYGMTQEDVPDDLRNFSIVIPDSSCAFYKGAKIGTAEDLMESLTRNESFDTTTCTEPGFDHDAFDMSFKVIEPNSKPSMQPSASRSPSLTPTALNEQDLSNIPSTLEFRTKEPDIQAMRTRSPIPHNEKDEILTSQHPTQTMDPMTGPSSFPTMQPSVSRSISPTTKISAMPSASIRPSLKGSLLPTVSDSPSENSSDIPTQSTGQSIKPSATPSISIDPSPVSSIGPSQSPKERRTRAPVQFNEKDQILTSQNPTHTMDPSLMPSIMPTDSVSASKNPSDVPTQSVGPSRGSSMNPSISVDPASMPSIGPSLSLIPTTEPSTFPSESIEPSLRP